MRNEARAAMRAGTVEQINEEVGGFDESFTVAFNDVDLCMKIRKAGYLIVYNPYAELNHYESKSRGYEDTEEKIKRINELARKQKAEGLTEEEKQEQFVQALENLCQGNYCDCWLFNEYAEKYIELLKKCIKEGKKLKVKLDKNVKY